MNDTTKSFVLLGLITLFAVACSKDEQTVAPTDDNEAITTVTLKLTNKAILTDTMSATIESLNTGADFSKATLNLKANTTYTGVITLLDKTKAPPLDATEEIKEKTNEHLFVYTPSTGLALTITLTDKDTNPVPGPYPVGLTTEMKTGTAGSGKLKVVLRHQPNVKDGTASPGSSDLDADFPVTIQ